MSDSTDNLNAIRWMVWKENRLVLPLFAGIIGVIALVTLLQSLFDSSWGVSQLSEYVLLLFPLMMATGLGLVLVGQEREDRTIDWIRILPLSSSRLIAIKMGVAILWMGLSWGLAVAFGLGGPISMTEIVPSVTAEAFPLSYPFWVVQSVFVLLAGFFAAWRFSNGFKSIAAMAMVSAIPALINGVSNTWNLPSAALRHTFWWTLLLIPGLALLSVLAGRRALSPAKPPRDLRANGRPALDRRTPNRKTDGDDPSQQNPSQQNRNSASAWLESSGRTFASSSPALIWESITSSRGMILGLVGMVMVGTLVPFVTVYLDPKSPALASPMALVFLVPVAVIWAGVSVFQNDGSSDRLRFLADRGVSPWQAYYSRQLPMVSWLCLIGCLYIVAATLMVLVEDGQHRISSVLPSPIVLVLIGGVMYAVSQWMSQLIRGPVLAFLLSPIVAVAAVGWFVFCFAQTTSPLWWVALVGLTVPMFATWYLMRRFMEGRERPHSFVIAFIAAGLMVALPLIPAFRRIQSVETMPSVMRSQLLAEASQVQRSSPRAIKLRRSDLRSMPQLCLDFEKMIVGEKQYLKKTPINLRDLTPVPAQVKSVLQWVEGNKQSPEKMIENLNSLNRQPSLAASAIDLSWFRGVFDEMHLVRLEVTSNRTPSDDQIRQMQQWVKAASQIAERFRRSVDSDDQEIADILEIELADVFLDTTVTKHLDRTVIRQAINRLPSTQERNASRRRSVLASWHISLDRRRVHRRFELDHGIHHAPPGLTPWLKKRRAEAIVMALLDGTEHPLRESWRRTLHRFQLPPGSSFDQSVYGSVFRDLPAVKTLRLNLDCPGRYWGMTWERNLEQLRGQYSEKE